MVVALAGALIAVALFGRISAPIGPFDTTLAFRPVGGGAQVAVPPLGALAVDVYDGPLRLEIALQRVDQERARALASDPVRLAGVVNEVTDDLRGAVVRLAWTTAGLAIGGAALTSLVVYRRRGANPLLAAGITTVLLLGTAGIGAATWRPEALSQPKYTGLLVNANSLIGSAEDIAARFDAYRASLEDLVENVGSLYSTLSALPAPGGIDDTVALLHVSDLHLNPAGFDLVRQVVDQFKVDARARHRRHHRLGQRAGEPADHLGRHPRRALRLHPGQPRLRDHGGPRSPPSRTRPCSTTRPSTVAGIEIVGAPDPLFTPDKSTGDDDASDDVLVESGQALADFAEDAARTAGDRPGARPEAGRARWTASSRWSWPATRTTAKSPVMDDGTRLMVEGSTGGAGLRGLQGEEPTPLTCTVLYLDPDTGELRAYDEITLGGLGETEVTIQRTVVPLDRRRRRHDRRGRRPAAARPASPSG